DGAAVTRLLCDFLFRCRKLGVPPFSGAGNAYATPVRQHHRPGKSFGSTSRAFRDAAVSAAFHGDAAVAAGKSVACIRPRAVARDFASRHERNLFARSAPCGRTCFRAWAGACVAFRTFRSDARNATIDVVSRVLCPVHDLSLRFPSPVRRENRAVGDSSACWSIAFLSYLPARSHRIPERRSRPGAARICIASITWIVRPAKTHAAHEPGTQRTTGALWRRCALFHNSDFP